VSGEDAARKHIRHHMEHDTEISTMIFDFPVPLRPRFPGDDNKRLAIEILRRDDRFAANLCVPEEGKLRAVPHRLCE
jgi:hypothetical protein